MRVLQLEAARAAVARAVEEKARADGYAGQMGEQAASVEKLLAAFKRTQEDLATSTSQNKARIEVACV
jgi:hypothetical protein